MGTFLESEYYDWKDRIHESDSEAENDCDALTFMQ